MPIDTGVCPSCGAQQGPDLLRPADATSEAPPTAAPKSASPTSLDPTSSAAGPTPPPIASRSTPGATLGVYVAAVVVVVGALVAGAWGLWGRHHDSGGRPFAATTTTRPPTSSAPSSSAAPSTTGPHRAVTPLQLSRAWRYDSADSISGLAGDSNRVYAVTNPGATAALVTLDATTGRPLWHASLGEHSVGRPVASGGLIATVSMTPDNYASVQVRDGATGRLVWQRGGAFPAGPLLAAGNLVVEVAGPGLDTTIVGLDLYTGQQRWSLQPSVGDLAKAHTDGERLFLPEAPGLYAIDGASGRVAWTHPDSKGAVMVTAGGRLLLAGVDASPPDKSAERWRAIDPASGVTLWTQSIGNLDTAHEAVLVDGQVVTPSDGLDAYAGGTGALTWSRAPSDGLMSSPPLAAVATHLLTAGEGPAGPALQELDPSTGALLRATPVSYPGDILTLDHLVVVEVLGGLEAFRY